MHDLVTILLILAALCFAVEAVGVRSRLNFLPLGLLAWVLSIVIPRIW
jgi:hypothetical protein